MKEGWEKENIEKSKKVLKEHFALKKLFRDFEHPFNRLCVPEYSTYEIHCGSNWGLDDSDFLDLDKERKDFFDKLIWKEPDLTKG